MRIVSRRFNGLRLLTNVHTSDALTQTESIAAVSVLCTNLVLLFKHSSSFSAFVQIWCFCSNIAALSVLLYKFGALVQTEHIEVLLVLLC